jgi:hypothetical protein
MSLVITLYEGMWFEFPLIISIIFIHVRWVPCHYSMARPQGADGGDTLQVWRIAVNIVNKKPQTADKGCSFSLGVGSEANNSSP